MVSLFLLSCIHRTMEKMIKNPEVLTVCSDDELLKSLQEVRGRQQDRGS